MSRHITPSLGCFVLVWLSLGTCAFAAPEVAAPVRSVAIEPFRVSGEERLTWLGEALARDLLTAAASVKAQGHIAPLSATVPTSAPATEGASPTAPASTMLAQAARDAGVDAAVGGQVQVIDHELRIAGEVVAADGRVLGALKATGPLRELFRLEDELSTQFIALLGGEPPGGEPPRVEILRGKAPGADRPATTPLVQPYVAPPTYVYPSEPSYTYIYTRPYYSYYYPRAYRYSYPYTGSLFFSTGLKHHHHHGHIGSVHHSFGHHHHHHGRIGSVHHSFGHHRHHFHGGHHHFHGGHHHGHRGHR